MPRSLASSMRRMNRLMGPVKLTKQTRALQKAMTGMMAGSAAITPKPKTKPKPKPQTKPKTTATPKQTSTGRNLGAVVRQMRAMRSFAGGKSAPAVTPHIAPGAQYLSRQHRSATGSRSYRLYIPASLHENPKAPAQPKALLLMLHGCQQTPDDFATGTHMNALAEKHGLVVAYPHQTTRNNAAACWNWFKPAHQMRGAGEPAILAALARKLMREFGLERAQVFVAGLSAGGAMAAILADMYPDVFAACGIHSGLPRGAAHDTMSAMSVMRKGLTSLPDVPPPVPASPPVRRIIFHGSADSTVNVINAAAIVAAAVGADTRASTTSQRSVRGRGYTRTTFQRPADAAPLEMWLLDGGGHAWSGGRKAGSFTDSTGPDAAAQMVRFFLADSR